MTLEVSLIRFTLMFDVDVELPQSGRFVGLTFSRASKSQGESASSYNGVGEYGAVSNQRLECSSFWL